MSVLVGFVVLATSIWVAMDASQYAARYGALGIKGPSMTLGAPELNDAGLGPISWFLATCMLWIAAFPLYLVRRTGVAFEAGYASRSPRCPNGHEVIVGAACCGHCGRPVETNMSELPQAVRPSTAKMHWVIGGIFVFLVLINVVVLFYLRRGHSPTPTPVQPQPTSVSGTVTPSPPVGRDPFAP